MKKNAAVAGVLLLALRYAEAVEFEPMNKAIIATLGTPKAVKKSLPALPGTTEAVTVFFAKDASGKTSKLAFIQRGIYEPNCSHTWVVGVDAATSKVSGVRVVEMSCPHAFPTREANFLKQYVGKGPADVKTIDKQIDTIAKATASANLTTQAVKRSIEAAVKYKGQL